MPTQFGQMLLEVFNIGKTNSRGQILLEFAEKHKLIIANTLYNHKHSMRITWHSPNGITYNPIDYILTSQIFKSSINKTNIRTYPGAIINSDHDLVICDIKMNLGFKKEPKSLSL